MFHWRVPKDCIALFGGKKFIVKSLKTHSTRDARLRRNILLAEHQKKVHDFRHGTTDREFFLSSVELISQQSDENIESAWVDALDKTPQTPDQKIHKEALRFVHKGIPSDYADITLKDAFQAFKSERSGDVAEKTIVKAERATTVFLAHLQQPDTSLSSVTRKEVRLFLKVMQSQYASGTVSDFITMLSLIWKVAHDEDLIGENISNPFADHRIKTKDKESYQLLPEGKLQEVFEATKEFKDGGLKAYKYFMPRLGLVTGCRIAELASLRVNQVLKKGDITYIDIDKGKTKNSKRILPIHSEIADELWKQREQVAATHSADSLLFPALKTTRQDGNSGDKYSKEFGRLKNKLGITERKYAFHSLRVHMATNFERASIPEERAVWVMGHTRNLSLTYGLYSKGPSLEQLRDDVEKAVVWPDS